MCIASAKKFWKWLFWLWIKLLNPKCWAYTRNSFLKVVALVRDFCQPSWMREVWQCIQNFLSLANKLTWQPIRTICDIITFRNRTCFSKAADRTRKSLTNHAFTTISTFSQKIFTFLNESKSKINLCASFLEEKVTMQCSVSSGFRQSGPGCLKAG